MFTAAGQDMRLLGFKRFLVNIGVITAKALADDPIEIELLIFNQAVPIALQLVDELGDFLVVGGFGCHPWTHM